MIFVYLFCYKTKLLSDVVVVDVWGWKRTSRREGKEEEEENGAFAFVNGKPETQKGRKKPRTVVMDGVLLVVCFSGIFYSGTLSITLLRLRGLNQSLQFFCLVAAS
jgi:hypothetical protein